MTLGMEKAGQLILLNLTHTTETSLKEWKVLFHREM